MTTAIVTTVVDHTTTAGFRTWGAEFHAQLVAIGLTLSSDTGQINWTTVTYNSVANTVSGYEIWQFNDSLQSTTPIFIKIEFGSTQPLIAAIWITVGNGSNGSGTLTGLTTVRAQCQYYSSAYLSTVIPYISRFVYNSTLGFFGFVWKTGSVAAGMAAGSAFIFRSNDSSGASTPTTVNLLTYCATSPSNGQAHGIMQCLNYTTGINYPITGGNGGWWSSHPFALTNTTDGINFRVDPVFYLSPTINVSVNLGRALFSEVPLGTTVTATLVGSTSHSYVQVGCPWMYSSSATTYVGLDAQSAVLNGTVLGLLMLWE